jgi:hypothetical protein
LKSKHLLPLLVSMILILILVATSCTPTGGPTVTVTVTPPAVTVTPQAVTKEKTVRAVNPSGIFVPVQTKPLALRLDTIDNKTIYVCQGEADPVIMPALYERLKKDYPKTTWIYYDRSDFGPSVPGSGGAATSSGKPEDPDILKKVQAVIRGIGW